MQQAPCRAVSSEVVDVFQTLGIGSVVIGIRNDVAQPGHVHIVRRQTIADAHLVQISIAGEREE